jgi:hypothetical protein
VGGEPLPDGPEFEARLGALVTELIQTIKRLPPVHDPTR